MRDSLIKRSLWHYRRMHASVAAGVVVATLVLVGALIVGDSVRGSLHGLTLERLGRIEQAIAPGRTFRAELAAEVAPEAQSLFTIRATLSHKKDGVFLRAGGATLVGCSPEFWSLGTAPEDARSFSDSSKAYLTRDLADELRVDPGDRIVIRVATADPLPADSPLGEKSETTASLRLKVDQILEPEGLARFGLRPSQQSPRNLFLPIDRVQELLDLPNQANVVVIPAKEPIEVKPSLADYGLSLFEQRPGVWQLESEALVLSPEVVAAAERAWNDDVSRPVITYLANTLKIGDRSVPYSTVAAVDWPRFANRFATREDLPGDLQEDELILNQWAAEDLEASVGDQLLLTYYEPESTHGKLREAEPVQLKVAGIVPLEYAPR